MKKNNNNKHAFMIMARDADINLRMLLKSLDHEDNDIYLHVDAKAGIIDTTGMVEKSSLKVCDRINVNWAAQSQVSAEMLLIKAVISENIEYKYIHLLSGNDLLIVDHDKFHNFFKNTNKQFVDIESIDEKINVRRIKYYFPLQELVGKKHGVLWMLQKVLMYLQIVVGVNRKTSLYNHIAKGANWFSITLNCGIFILNKEKEINKYFSKGQSADELFLQTILINSEYKNDIINNNQRYTKWNKGENSPEILTMNDLKSIEESNKLIARKFDYKVSSNIMKKLTETGVD
ncbi:beta-1,6-N-acetylglucosaminyltransferase [Dellaglioa algida]|uniref:Peptide O-xylosyltransferase n=1 Tax=Dellaglioa algida TaxID=105612 RepID=A0A5C6MA41_9LACO|nr:beta-1,6-N-acetylglucosaminyltransferase [Dellaglioa algida]MDK1717135.1 beta-1,6-N-acetylglucosaminyltransferase [Dellaglioa algida]MDK1719795.1 beta-1,6-N-acetylglucosaminyltransferase [Dellaglioa algida]MDK1722077.1 beta-1,6-N-acetylglucosaminyltransferase [Dellaglioa algida]MDK1723138.1 beta-1,6-N-acetylglucosaminyltransferase [Dellaglioa algida]MDK1739910.1 beta-1,6-N-acetylglucosaminyltransferase [Dellaglioa algida]